jgi:hypothetical protein
MPTPERDFCNAQSRLRMQDEGFALRFGQGGQQPPEALDLLLGFELDLGLVGGCGGNHLNGIAIVVCNRKRWSMRGAPVVIDQSVVRNPVQECCEPCFGDVIGSSTHDAQPNVLKQLLRQRRIPALAQQVTVQSAPVAPVEPLERHAIVAIAVRSHERLVAGCIVVPHRACSMREARWACKFLACPRRGARAEWGPRRLRCSSG